MKVGSDTADTLKKQSKLQQIPFANLLWIYMAEDMMQRFYQSSYKEILWLENDEFLEEREDLTRAERQIRFLHKQSERSCRRKTGSGTEIIHSDDGASDRGSIWRKECATDSLAMGHSAKKRGL